MEVVQKASKIKKTPLFNIKGSSSTTDTGLHKQRSNSRSPNTKMLSVANLFSPKTLRRSPSGNRFVKNKPIYSLPKIQNVHSFQNSERLACTSVVHKPRCARRFSPRTTPQKVSQVCSLLPRRKTLLFSNNAIRTQHKPVNLHKTVKIPFTSTTQKRNHNNSVPRRLVGVWEDTRRNLPIYNTSIGTSPELGFQNKPQKIDLGTIDVNILSRSDVAWELCNPNPRPPEVRENFLTRLQVTAEVHDPPSGLAKTRGYAEFRRPFNQIRQTPNVPVPALPCTGEKSDNFDGFEEHDRMVGQLAVTRLCRIMEAPQNVPHPVDGCVKRGVGSSDRVRGQFLEAVGRRNQERTHHIQRDHGSSLSITENKNCTEFDNINLHRLRNNMLRCEQIGFGTICTAEQDCNSASGDSRTNKLLPQSTPHPREDECVGRLAIPANTQSRRMDLIGSVVQRPRDNERPIANRSIRTSRKCQTPGFCMSLQTSINTLGGQSPIGLEPMESNLSFSSPSSTSRSSGQIEELQRSWGSDSSRLPVSNLVGGSQPICPRSTDNARHKPRNASGSAGATVTHVIRLSRVQFLKYVLNRNLTPEVTEALINAHRKTTQRQYQHCWTSFQKYLLKEKIQIINISNVLKYLIYLEKQQKLLPNSIAVHKNALQLPLKYGFNICTNATEFSLLSRSQFISNPPRKKIIPQWSISKVLNMLESPKFSGPNVNIENLLSKCIFLLALATGNRVSEISAFDRSGVRFSPDMKKVNLHVKPGFLYKNERLSHSPPRISVPSLSQNNEAHKLCPVKTLNTWLNKTKDFSGNALFFDVKTAKSLNAGRISHVLCKIINEADPGCFPHGHDVRKVATSLAWTRGLSLTNIVQNAFWKSPSVFVKKYLFFVEDTPNCISLLS